VATSSLSSGLRHRLSPFFGRSHDEDVGQRGDDVAACAFDCERVGPWLQYTELELGEVSGDRGCPADHGLAGLAMRDRDAGLHMGQQRLVQRAAGGKLYPYGFARQETSSAR
jgi:hypothetical protein